MRCKAGRLGQRTAVFFWCPSAWRCASTETCSTPPLPRCQPRQEPALLLLFLLPPSPLPPSSPSTRYQVVSLPLRFPLSLSLSLAVYLTSQLLTTESTPPSPCVLCWVKVKARALALGGQDGRGAGPRHPGRRRRRLQGIAVLGSAEPHPSPTSVAAAALPQEPALSDIMQYILADPAREPRAVSLSNACVQCPRAVCPER